MSLDDLGLGKGRNEPVRPSGVPEEADPAPAPERVAGRYRVGRLLGRGGTGRVFEAVDDFSGTRVALKLLDAGPLRAAPRVRREVSALRLLRLPGIVTLLDDGTHAGCPFLVMELVEGTPFPAGPEPRAWDELAPVVLALLEVLARVHAAGVVHRDLKPGNVLVDGDGRPTLLDLGLSTGPALGAGVTEAGALIGTPEYLAPEQVAGGAVDARTDLYALGVMLFEALTGRLPHEATNLRDMIHAKLGRLPLPVRRLAPDVPARVADAVDQLLAFDPGGRPRSAGEAIGLLFGEEPPRRAEALPRLGGDAAARALLDAARTGRSLDVAGPRGSGRSRVLGEVVAALRAGGREVFLPRPASGPFESLAELLGTPGDLRAERSEAALLEFDRRLRERLAGGVVVAADDPERLDRWSAAALDRARDAGTVLRSARTGFGSRTPPPGAVLLEPLSEEDLRPLFAGPDRVFHLREDAARELWLRTGGLPSRVEGELAAWVRAGIAHRDGSRYAVRREGLDRMRGGLPIGGSRPTPEGRAGRTSRAEDLLAWVALAWPDADVSVLAAASGAPRWAVEAEVEALAAEGAVGRLPDGRVQPLCSPLALQGWPREQVSAAHRAVAEALPAESTMRFRHVAAACTSGEVADEAVRLAGRLVREARTADAVVVLEEALRVARGEDDRDSESRLVPEYVKACLATATPHALDRALYEVGRALRRVSGLEPLATFLRGVADASRAADSERALQLLTNCGPFDDLDLELWRHAQRWRATRHLPPSRQEAVLRDIGAWADAIAAPRALASHADWLGMYLHRQGRSAEAAALHLSAALRTERVTGRLASQYNAAEALLECGEPARALAIGESVRELAAQSRHALFELRGESIVRTALHRLGRAGPPDFELVELARLVGVQAHVGIVALTEAAVAWKARDPQAAAELARIAAAACAEEGLEWGSTLAQCLVTGCGADPADGVDVLARRCDVLDPPLAVQCLGLLATREGPHAAELRRRARRIAERVPPEARGRIREVMSVDDALGS